MQRRQTPQMMESIEADLASVDRVFGDSRPQTWLLLSAIRMDGGTQSRVRINEQVVENYAEAMRQGKVFKPVKTVFDGTDYWLSDGFHRVLAAKKVEGKTTILADVRQGTLRDAVLASLGANSDHGLQRSDDDKRQVVMRMLEDAEWVKWSNAEIARQCDVSAGLVARLRDSISNSVIDRPKEEERIVKRNGAEYTMKVGNIGRPSSPWSPLTWAVHDWAVTKSGQPVRSVQDAIYFKDKYQKWFRLVAFIEERKIEPDKSLILKALPVVLKALREDSVPERDPEPGSAIEEPAIEVVAKPERVRLGSIDEAPVVVVPDLVVNVEAESVPAGGWISKAKEPQPTNGKKKAAPFTIQISKMEVIGTNDGRKIVTFYTADNQQLPVEFLPEQASWLAGELLNGGS
mgnify:CR=1 FL=1